MALGSAFLGIGLVLQLPLDFDFSKRRNSGLDIHSWKQLYKYLLFLAKIFSSSLCYFPWTPLLVDLKVQNQKKII